MAEVTNDIIKQQRLDKQEVVDVIKQKLSKSSAFYVSRYDGINVEDISRLRKELKSANSEMKVYKNTLVKLALQEEVYGKEFDSLLLGPNSITFAYDDPTSTAKILFDFAKKNKSLVIKGCLFDNEFYGPDKMSVIKDLPSKHTLLSMLANVLSAPMSKVARTLDALREKKEQS
ncbi:MAG: 50S ribosomal protein L10 [Candidatus Delongbacteria bacterium]|nr:50S ribosomal protein L10 [Candidatus Delongbacteria bacterium]